MTTDELSTNVLCSDCKYHLYSFYKFRLKVQDTDVKFKEAEINEVKVEVKVESLMDDDEGEEFITTYVDEVRYSDAEEVLENVEYIVEKLEDVSDTEIPAVKSKSNRYRPKRKTTKNTNVIKDFASPMDRLNPFREKVRVERMPRRKESLKLYKRNDKGVYECPKCPSTFSFLGRLELHLDIEHAFEGQTSFPCSQCNLVFPFFKELKYHIDELHTRKLSLSFFLSTL